MKPCNKTLLPYALILYMVIQIKRDFKQDVICSMVVFTGKK